jgi:hypothetical protein
LKQERGKVGKREERKQLNESNTWKFKKMIKRIVLGTQRRLDKRA